MKFNRCTAISLRGAHARPESPTCCPPAAGRSRPRCGEGALEAVLIRSQSDLGNQMRLLRASPISIRPRAQDTGGGCVTGRQEQGASGRTNRRARRASWRRPRVARAQRTRPIANPRRAAQASLSLSERKQLAEGRLAHGPADVSRNRRRPCPPRPTHTWPLPCEPAPSTIDGPARRRGSGRKGLATAAWAKLSGRAARRPAPRHGHGRGQRRATQGRQRGRVRARKGPRRCGPAAGARRQPHPQGEAQPLRQGGALRHASLSNQGRPRDLAKRW